MAKVKITLSNHRDYSYDGGLWLLSVKRLEFEGKVLTNPGRIGTPFHDKVRQLLRDDLDGPAYVCYYNDNPSAYGVPDSTVTLRGVKLEVEDLVDSCSDDGCDPSYVEIEVEAPVGFSL